MSLTAAQREALLNELATARNELRSSPLFVRVQALEAQIRSHGARNSLALDDLGEFLAALHAADPAGKGLTTSEIIARDIGGVKLWGRFGLGRYLVRHLGESGAEASSGSGLVLARRIYAHQSRWLARRAEAAEAMPAPGVYVPQKEIERA